MNNLGSLKYKLFLIIFIILLPFTLMMSPIKSSADEPTWQTGDGAIVKLGIRDKYGDAGRYTATFILNAPDGKQYKAIKNGVGSDFYYVIFPDDFGSVFLTNGNYTYKTMVGNKVIYTGSFQYHNRSVKMSPTGSP